MKTLWTINWNRFSRRTGYRMYHQKNSSIPSVWVTRRIGLGALRNGIQKKEVMESDVRFTRKNWLMNALRFASWLPMRISMKKQWMKSSLTWFDFLLRMTGKKKKKTKNNLREWNRRKKESKIRLRVNTRLKVNSRGCMRKSTNTLITLPQESSLILISILSFPHKKYPFPSLQSSNDHIILVTLLYFVCLFEYLLNLYCEKIKYCWLISTIYM